MMRPHTYIMVWLLTCIHLASAWLPLGFDLLKLENCRYSLNFMKGLHWRRDRRTSPLIPFKRCEDASLRYTQTFLYPLLTSIFWKHWVSLVCAKGDRSTDRRTHQPIDRPAMRAFDCASWVRAFPIPYSQSVNPIRGAWYVSNSGTAET